MKNLFAQTETVCAGRFLLDVPKGAKVTLDARYFGVRTETSGARTSLDSLSQELQKRADALKAQPMDPSLLESYNAFDDLKSVQISPTRLVQLEKDAATGSIFLAYLKSGSDATLVIEQHKLVEQRDYTFILEGGLGAGDYANRKARMVHASESFVPRGRNEVPQQAGFCVADGYYKGAGTGDSFERFTLTLGLAEAPDVTVSLDSSIVVKKADEPSLLQRLTQRSGIAGQIPGFKVLRQGHPAYGGFGGDELLTRSDNESLPGAVQYQFHWESAGAPGSVQKPALSTEMDTGQTVGNAPHPSSFGESEAVEFWDKLLASLRIRGSD